MICKRKLTFYLSNPGTIRLVVDQNYYLKFNDLNQYIYAVNSGIPVNSQDFDFNITFFLVEVFLTLQQWHRCVYKLCTYVYNMCDFTAW